MGKRGVAPKPTALKLLEGAPAHRINTSEPIPPDNGCPLPPAWLGSVARETWHALAPGLHARGVLSAWDADSFAVFCNAVAMHRWACVELEEAGGLLVKSERGIVKHPALQVARDSAQTIRAFAQEFGLTPSARSGLHMDEVTDDSELRRLLS